MSDVGVLHPVRIRVAQILALGPHTGTQLRQALPDVPYSSLYRHIRWLLDAGVIRVAGERKVRGAVEHTYELDEHAIQGAVPDPAALSAGDHKRASLPFCREHLQPLADTVDDGRSEDIERAGVADRQADDAARVAIDAAMRVEHMHGRSRCREAPPGAHRTTSRGGSEPSECVECDWRSNVCSGDTAGKGYRDSP